MKRESIYIDTSVPSAYFDLREPEKMAVTRQFWKDANDKYKLYLSNITIAELDADKESKRVEYRDLIKDIPILEISSDVDRIVELYIKANIIPVKFRVDAIHLAIHKIDYFAPLWRSLCSLLPLEKNSRFSQTLFPFISLGFTNSR